MGYSRIYLVDDDDGVLLSTQALLELFELKATLYSSGAKLLEDVECFSSGCMIVDYEMPGMSGLELINEVRARGKNFPFLLVSAHATIPIAVEAVKLGAVNIIEKPYRADKFIENVNLMLQLSRQLDDEQSAQEQQDDPRALLTPREMQVLEFVVQGHLSKHIAALLNISCKTVEVHRSNITKKFKVDSVAQLVGRVLQLDPEVLSRNSRA